jgi:hypothetical protein
MAYSSFRLREEEFQDFTVQVVPHIDGDFRVGSNLLRHILSHRLPKLLRPSKRKLTVKFIDSSG